MNKFVDRVIADLMKQDVGAPDEYAISRLINDIYRCDFSNSPLTQAYAFELQNFISIAMANRHAFKFCTKLKIGMNVCLDPTVLGEICEMFPKRLIMDQNIHMKEVEQFLSNKNFTADFTFKVIWLVRDPRAVTSSRKSHQLCDSISDSDCVDVPKLCQQLETDTDAGKSFSVIKGKKLISFYSAGPSQISNLKLLFVILRLQIEWRVLK